MKIRVYKISRYENDQLLGYYIQPEKELKNAIEAELNNENEINTKIVFELTEMDVNQYNNLPEFAGY